MYRLLRNWRFWILAGAAAWIVTIFMLIGSTPAPGAASPEELANRVAAALRGENAADLAEVISFEKGGDEAAKATIEGFAAVGATDISTRPEQHRGRTHVVVEYKRGDGSTGVLRLPTVHAGETWRLTPVAAP